MCYENNLDRGIWFNRKGKIWPSLEIIVVLMWLKPVTITIYAFNVESQQHNDDGLIGLMIIMLVNQNKAMTSFLSKEWKNIIIIIFILYDTHNNVDVDSQWYWL